MSEAKYFIFQSKKIHYQIHGTGAAVVLLHGFLEATQIWEGVFNYFKKRRQGYQFIAMDFPGHGQSAALDLEIYTMPVLSKIVYELLEYLKITRFFLIGHSMGGYVAATFADAYPEKILGICLLNSTCCADSSARKIARNRAIQAVKNNHRTFIRTSIPLLFGDGAKKAIKPQIQKMIQIALKTEVKSILASLKGMRARTDKTPIWQGKYFYKMLILGREDALFSLENIQKEIRGTDTNLLQIRSGHMSLLENETATLEALELFLKKSSYGNDKSSKCL